MAASPVTPSEGATAVITHRVRMDKHDDYEAWLREIAPLAKSAPGHLDWHIVRPLPGLTQTYTVILRFDTTANVQQWMASADRQRLIDQVQPLLDGGDSFHISSGLDFLFTPPGAKSRAPVRWKQFVLTWSAIYPLALGVPFLVNPLLHAAGLPASLPVATLFITAVVVFMMVYVVMPHYTRLVQRWLFA